MSNQEIFSQGGAGLVPSPLCMSTDQGNAEIAENLCPTLSCNHEAPIAFCIAENIIGRQDHNGGNGSGHQEELAYTLNTVAAPAVAFAQNTRDEVREMNIVGALAAQPGMKQTSYIRQDFAVRRLTPTECARLQGFPDDHCRIPWRGKPAEDCPDGPQYKAYGNSMAVPVMFWIGSRIQKIENYPCNRSMLN